MSGFLVDVKGPGRSLGGLQVPDRHVGLMFQFGAEIAGAAGRTEQVRIVQTPAQMLGMLERLRVDVEREVAKRG
ncbi:MAG TPA: hypothetical protein VGW74_19775 [Propionibacteriaceae bacterium]|nr:hypothetical protein [Propionibacteriaceae bacterium]